MISIADKLLFPLSLGQFRFQGRAGDLQQNGSEDALLNELAAGYATYHAQVASAHANAVSDLSGIRGEAGMTSDVFDRGLGRGVSGSSAQFVETHEAFLQAASRRMESIHAELLLRIALARREGRKGTLNALDPKHPIVDDKDRLLDWETARAITVPITLSAAQRAAM